MFIFCDPKSQEAVRAQVIQPRLHNTIADPVNTSQTVPILLQLPKAIENLYIWISNTFHIRYLFVYCNLHACAFAHSGISFWRFLQYKEKAMQFLAYSL